jgi:hypothetical protein
MVCDSHCGPDHVTGVGSHGPGDCHGSEAVNEFFADVKGYLIEGIHMAVWHVICRCLANVSLNANEVPQFLAGDYIVRNSQPPQVQEVKKVFPRLFAVLKDSTEMSARPTRASQVRNDRSINAQTLIQKATICSQHLIPLVPCQHLKRT